MHDDLADRSLSAVAGGDLEPLRAFAAARRAVRG
jgi:hypothetical protein